MLSIKPYIVVPTLVEQSTWGGDYIAKFKNIDQQLIHQKKIGQSYELFRDSHLSLKKQTLHNPSIDLATPSTPDDPERLYFNDEPFSVSQLIVEDPEKVLGRKVLDEHGHSVEIMIKFTQAKGNSYQVHASNPEPESRWLPKPESWYYLEPGLATLGLKDVTNWREYKQVCELIYEESKLISKAIVQQNISLEEGRQQLAQFIKKHHPVKYVNLVQVAKHAAIDLSTGGTHHSWESNQQTHPQGNILYEVQKNVYDPDCTIRSFDAGKIKDDGTVRALHIEDYFAALNKQVDNNIPDKHYTKGNLLKKTSTYTAKSIFGTSHYSMDEITFSKAVNNKFTTTTDSFHHLFVTKGNIKLQVNSENWTISRGYSIFIPASTGKYSVTPFKAKSATILKTFL